MEVINRCQRNWSWALKFITILGNSREEVTDTSYYETA